MSTDEETTSVQSSSNDIHQGTQGTFSDNQALEQRGDIAQDESSESPQVVRRASSISARRPSYVQASQPASTYVGK